jgi:hypothetical protein
MSTPADETEPAAPPPEAEETSVPIPADVPPAAADEVTAAAPSTEESAPQEEPTESGTPPEEAEKPVTNEDTPVDTDEVMEDAEEPQEEKSAEAPVPEAAEEAPAAEPQAESSEPGAVTGQKEPGSKGSEESKEEPPLDDATGASESKSEGEQAAEDSATSKELPYSTRGRSTGTDKDASSGEEKLSAADVLEEIGRAKDASPATMGVSFLESLTDEERRTRTRFVPDVEGMHVLRKHEIRDDLSLARSLVSSSGITSLKKSKGNPIDGMDVDEEGGTSPSEDGSTDAHTKLLELPTRDLVVPSNAFVAPPAASGDDEGQTTSISALKTQNGVKSPLLIESVTAFNPPRPPESIGAKKKHRMLRWERRPEDVEVDLNNYRKTVQRTRQELHKAEGEYNRLETIDAHLRWNFLNHLNLMNEEYTRLNEEIGTVQQECVKAADLLTSRTRSRGGKGSYVMRDVLSVLKAKGSENTEAMDTPQFPIIENPLGYPGIGGLAPSVFGDWNRKTAIAQKEPASAWTVPGDKVKTPYGEGVVVEVFAPESVVEAKEKEAEDDKQKANANGKKESSKKIKKGASKKEAEKPEEKFKKEYLCNYLLPRVSVKLPFGIGYFPCDAIEPLENPCLFSDAKLCARWKNMVETAKSVGGTIDLEGMNFNSRAGPRESEVTDGEGAKMDVDGAAVQVDVQPNEEVVVKADDEDEERFMPFGAGLLPTASGRGNLLQDISISEIEKAMENALYNGSGVLGLVGFLFWLACFPENESFPHFVLSLLNCGRNLIKGSQRNFESGKMRSKNFSHCKEMFYSFETLL